MKLNILIHTLIYLVQDQVHQHLTLKIGMIINNIGVISLSFMTLTCQPHEY